MKRSSTWFVSILIASALLLSAARNARGEPSGKQNTSKVEAGGREYAASNGPVTTPINQPTAYSSSTEGGRATYNYNGDFKYVAPANPPESGLRELGDVATILATVAAAFFAGMLWWVSRQQKELMKNAEAISRRSVEAAERALHIDRPYLLSEAVELKNFHSGSKRVIAFFTIKNWGTRPAFISQISARLGITAFDIGDIPVATDGTPAPIWRRREPSEFPKELVDYGWAIRLESDVIEPGEASPPCQTALGIETELSEDQLVIRLGHLPDDLFQRLTESGFNEKYGPTPDIQITLKGIVRYHDAALKELWTEFCWDFSANLIQFRDVGKFEVRYHRHGEESVLAT